MELKLDEAGNAVLQDGMPIYVHGDGTEIPLDAASLVRRVDNLTAEKDRHYRNLTETKAKLELFGELSPEDAKNALATVKNLKDKELLDADGVKALKADMGKQFETEKQSLLEKHQRDLADREAEKNALIKRIHDQHLLTEFQKSKFFVGDKKITKLPPEIGLTTFGKYFEIREEEDGTLSTIGKLNGEEIQSKKRFGFPADFDEAMEVIFENHPLKNELLEVREGGPEGPGGKSFSGGGRDVIISRSDAKDPAKWRAAKMAAAKKGGRVIRKD